LGCRLADVEHAPSATTGINGAALQPVPTTATFFPDDRRFLERWSWR
jgi:hypothetical protein